MVKVKVLFSVDFPLNQSIDWSASRSTPWVSLTSLSEAYLGPRWVAGWGWNGWGWPYQIYHQFTCCFPNFAENKNQFIMIYHYFCTSRMAENTGNVHSKRVRGRHTSRCSWRLHPNLRLYGQCRAILEKNGLEDFPAILWVNGRFQWEKRG